MSTSAPATPAAPEAPQNLDINSAASLLESLLPDEGEQEGAEPQPTEDEAAPVEAPAEETPAETEEPAEEGEPTEEQEEPTEEPANPDAEVVFEDHEGKPVTREEARKGYLRQGDYTRKTQAAAELKRQAEADIASVKADRARYIDGLKQYEEAMKAVIPQEPNWDEIKAKYPAEFPAAYAEYQLHQRKIAEAAQKRQAEEAKVIEERKAAYGEYLKGEQEKLVAALPVLKDPAKAKTELTALAKYAEQIGFKPEELASVSDHRALLILWKAAQYDAGKIKALPKKTVQTIKTTPVLKPGAAPSKGPKPTSTIKAQQAAKRLSSSGSIHDAAEALFHLLPD